jgi:nitrite reductase/ring-hydroxylating ferredoxin subunit
MTSRWTHALNEGDLPSAGATVFKHAGDQVAIFRVEDGRIFAVDNRCPHEGYPLAQGSVTDCVLTCNWHNYKFDLRDGACVMGEEAVRSFPVRVKDGRIEVDLAPPDPAKEVARLWESLDEGMIDHRLGRVARDVVRLLQHGVEPARIALYAARWDALHGEYGSTHALPVAGDVLRYFDRHTGPDAALPLVQLLDMTARFHVRRPLRTRPAPIDPGGDHAAAAVRFLALVEAEAANEAEALFRGALAKGWGPEIVLPWLQHAVSVHFLDFGHAQIYLIKAEDLLSHVGWAHADPVLTSLVFSIVTGTREDSLPKWASLRSHLADITDALPGLFEACTAQPDPAWDGFDALVGAILEGRRGEMFAALTDALGARAPLSRVMDAIAHASAERLLRFDVALDADPSLQDNWLSLTHTQTYANAVREALRRRPAPSTLRAVFFAARFVHNARPLDLSPDQRLDYHPRPHEGVDAVMAAIAGKRTEEAVGRAASWLASEPDPLPLQQRLEDLAIQDPVVRPIVVAHAIKNTMVAFDEHRVSGDPHPILALVRLLASPISERRVHRVAREAIAFVTEGKVPRVLTS